MVTVKTIRKYNDIELDKEVQVGFIQSVSPSRAKKLIGMGLVELLKISKLSKKEYAEVTRA